MKKYFSIMGFAALLLSAAPVYGMGGSMDGQSFGTVHLLIELATIMIIGGIMYSLWTTVKGFGGLIGSGLRYTGIGIVLLSLDTLDNILDHVAGSGMITILGTGTAYSIFHAGTILVGFAFLAFGISKLAKIVKGVA